MVVEIEYLEPEVTDYGRSRVRSVPRDDDVIMTPHRVMDRIKENRYRSGPYEEEFVDPEYRVADAGPWCMEKLAHMRRYFKDKGRSGQIIPYKDIVAYAIEHASYWRIDPSKVRHRAVACTVRKLWKAGVIRRYRRGIWKRPKWVTGGISFGVAYWIWD